MRRAVAWLFSLWFFLPFSKGEEIVLASYNVQNYLRMDRSENNRKVADAPKPEEEIAAVVKVIGTVRPDVLGLVEMGDEAMLEDLQCRLKAAGLTYPYREWVQAANADRHVCLFSRFPIISRNSVSDLPVPINNKLERMNRGILDVTIAVNPSYHLRLVGAHLKSRRPVPEYDETLMRAKEAWFLRDHVSRILSDDPQTKVLLFGDLNDTKNEYPIRTLIGRKGTSLHLTDLPLKDSRGELWTHFWKTADTYSRIDYIMVSQALVKDVNLQKSGINDSPFWNEGSDHRAIYATVSARKKP
ncbi:MAG: endonuclease/exonuclease/phosphatase family protein [Verrucomicrobiota bacterium]